MLPSHTPSSYRSLTIFCSISGSLGIFIELRQILKQNKKHFQFGNLEQSFSTFLQFFSSVSKSGTNSQNVVVNLKLYFFPQVYISVVCRSVCSIGDGTFMEISRIISFSMIFRSYFRMPYFLLFCAITVRIHWCLIFCIYKLDHLAATFPRLGWS